CSKNSRKDAKAQRKHDRDNCANTLCAFASLRELFLLPERKRLNVRQTTQQRRPGFTMTQLLIVILVVSVIVALAVPAVQKLRERQARTDSTNNLKAIVLGCHEFHDVNKRLPYNGTANAYVIDEFRYGGPASAGDNTTGSWAFMILPYVNQERIFLSADRGLPVAGYMCPARGRPALCRGAGTP